MKKLIYFSVLFILTGFIACRKELSYEGGVPPGNKLPHADAGEDQVTVLPKDSVQLDGTKSSDADGTIAKYKWTKVSGPASYAITDVNVVSTMVRQLVEGNYLFELAVTDNSGAVAKDTVQITVSSPASINYPPGRQCRR